MDECIYRLSFEINEVDSDLILKGECLIDI